MPKPIGALQINAAHALAPNIVALVIMESDGTVRELVTQLSLGLKISAALGAEIGLAEIVTGVNLGLNHSPFLSNFSSGSGQFSYAYFGALTPITYDVGHDFCRYGDTDTSAGGSYSLSFRESNAQKFSVWGGWSGSTIDNGVNLSFLGTSGVAQLASLSTVETAGVFSTQFYLDGVAKGSPSIAGFHVIYDVPRVGYPQYFNPQGTAALPHIYSVIFDKSLSAAEWAGLAADPYGIVQVASGGGSTFQAAWATMVNRLIGGL